MSEITRNQAIQIVEDIRTAISAGSVTNTMEAQVLEYCVSVLGRRIVEASLSGHIENLPDVAAFLAGISPSATLKALLEGITDAVEVINANIGNGYVYAGIATPSGTPVSGKVFYLAKQAGQYANFGGLTVTEGVNILKRNGSTWTQEQLLSMADIRKNPLIGYYECDTAGDTSAKTVTAAGYVLPATGGSVKIKMANRNTVANATLNINSTGAKPLYYNGQRAGVGNTWDTNEIIEVFYDGAKYQAYNVAGCNGDGVFDISAYNLTDGQPTPYEDLAAALGPDGNHVPLSLRKGGMSIKFVLGSDNKYVQYRLMAQTFSTNEADWQGVIDNPISESDDLVKSKGIFEAIKKSERGFVVDYNHLWNSYAIGDTRNRYAKFDTFDCVWVYVPKGAKRVHVDGISTGSYYYFSSYEISNDAHVCFRNYQEVKISVTFKADGADYIPYFVGESTPILLLIDVRKSDLPEGFSYDNVHVWFDYVEDTVKCESSLNGKKISILGDSISGFSTYTYWMDGDTKKFNNRYPARASYAVNNIMSIHQMWWKRLFDKCGAVLEVGSCIGSSGISDNRYYNMPSFLDRYADLGNPDVILIQGFHNEPSTAACTFDPLIPIGELDTLDVGQAYDKLIRLLKITYPSARIIDIGVIPWEKWVRASREIDDYYNIEHIECLRSDIDYTTITTDDTHPDSDGMERIADYVIERLANNAAHVATEEFVAENTLEEKEYSYSEEGVAGYITGKNGVIIAKIMKDGAIERTVKNGSDKIIDTLVSNINEIYGNTLQESVIEISEEGVVGYVTDKNRAILAKINQDGSINRLVENDRDRHTVHFEDVDIDGIVNLLVDKKNKIIASINDNAEVDFYGGGGFAGEKIIDAKTGEYVRLIVSKNNIVVGGIKPDGTVKIFKAEIDDLKHEDTDVTALIKSLPIIASGLDNISISNDKRVMNLLTSVNTKHIIEIPGNDIKSKLKPCISLIDDDTIDMQIPGSSTHSTPSSERCGYFSVLLPLMLSLGAKYHKNLCPGLACEGQRVGLTHLYSSDDTYIELNENGRCVKWVHDNIGWNVLNHSMTAQLPMNTYYVDGIDSELAQQILEENDVYYIPYSFRNCIVLDRLTGKWYELNTDSRNAWVERTPTKKYAMPFYQDYTTKAWYFNRDFDFEYNWGEWFKRADELGLPYEKVIVHNGNTSAVYTVFAGRKYANWSVRTNGVYNYPPIAATVNRVNGVNGNSDNIRDTSYESTLKNYIDETFNGKLWMVFMTHFDESPAYNNYYMTGVTYPDGDPNYPSDWIIPLKYSEIQDIIGENTHDYINHPPSRLNISTWDEWHPAPGTQLKSLYDVLDYALSKGVEFVSPVDGWNTHGNLLNIGVDRNGQTYNFDSAGAQTLYTEEEQSFLTIGADGSIRYFSK